MITELEQQQQEAVDKAKRLAEDELRDIKLALQHEYVQRFLWRFISRHCRLYSSSFTNNGWTNFFEGVRNVGLNMVSMLEQADPDIMWKMAQLNAESRVENLSIEKQGESDD